MFGLLVVSSYKKALYAWRDRRTGLNLLQLAVINFVRSVHIMIIIIAFVV